MISIGFDVGLVTRSLLKVGLGSGDVVLLLYSKSGGEYEQRRVEEAVRAVKDLLAGARIEHYEVAVTGMDFASDVIAILKALKERGKPLIVASLVGGMRLVIMEAVTALLLYKRFISNDAEIAVHVMREDGMYDITLPVTVMNPPELGYREITVLRELGKGLAGKSKSEIASALSKDMEISESMVFKALDSLEKKGIIKTRSGSVELTLLGKLMLSALE